MVLPSPSTTLMRTTTCSEMAVVCTVYRTRMASRLELLSLSSELYLVLEKLSVEGRTPRVPSPAGMSPSVAPSAENASCAGTAPRTMDRTRSTDRTGRMPLSNTGLGLFWCTASIIPIPGRLLRAIGI